MRAYAAEGKVDVGVNASWDLVRDHGMARPLDCPTLVVTYYSPNAIGVPGTGRSIYCFVAAEVLRRAAEAMLGTADVKGTAAEVGPLQAPAGVALRLCIAACDAVTVVLVAKVPSEAAETMLGTAAEFAWPVFVAFSFGVAARNATRAAKVLAPAAVAKLRAATYLTGD